jgi:hypothetical protein
MHGSNAMPAGSLPLWVGINRAAAMGQGSQAPAQGTVSLSGWLMPEREGKKYGITPAAGPDAAHRL